MEVKSIDGYLVTHIDNDHFSRITIKHTAEVTKSYHTTQYVAQVMREEGIAGVGHDIGDEFDVGNGNPMQLAEAIVNPERLKVLVTGEAYSLKKD